MSRRRPLTFDKMLQEMFQQGPTNPCLLRELEGRLFQFTPGKIQVQDDDGEFRDPTTYECDLGIAYLNKLRIVSGG